MKNKLFNSIFDDNRFSTLEVIIIIFISITLGIVSGYFITYKHSNLSKIREDENLGDIIDIYNSIINNYYQDVDSESLSLAAIKGMINSLDDPYSYYLDEDSTDTFKKTISSEYVGIGVTVEYKDGNNVIVEINKNGPADKVGLLIGDIIVSVDGKDCTGIYPTNLTKLIIGEENTSLVLSILRNNTIIDYKLIRKKIDIWKVTSNIIDDNIGYIKISTFSYKSFTQFKELLNEIEESNISGLIIDIRNNPGGHLSETNDILKLFFKKKTLLYYTKSNGKKNKIIDNTKECRTYPIVILVNGVTASSAEILASSFKDNYNDSVIIGTETYGKGSVQRNIMIGTSSSIKYTIENWYSSKGTYYGNNGIIPDIIIDSPEEQLDEAIKWIKNR